MSRFYIKNDKFRFECGDIRIEFSAPVIQAYDEYVEIFSMKEVLYFYYTVKFYKREYVSWNEETDEEIKRWKIVCGRDIHDFPCIEQLQYMLENIIKPIDKDDCQKVKYTDGTISFQYIMQTEGFICEDVYKITKLFSDKKTPKYSLYAGCTFDIQGDSESVGINSEYLTEDDLKVLLDCVNAFLDFSIVSHNKNISEAMEANTNSLKFMDGKLYQYKVRAYNVLYDEIDTIYSVGDVVNIHIEGYRDMFNNVYIENIDSDSITVIADADIYTAKFSAIYHIFNQVSNAMLHFDINEIKDDFKRIMSVSMIDDFKNLDINKLFKKYSEAIVSRTWMCRDEHHLPCLTISNDNHENVYANVRGIIAKIKEELLTS